MGRGGTFASQSLFGYGIRRDTMHVELKHPGETEGRVGERNRHKASTRRNSWQVKKPWVNHSSYEQHQQNLQGERARRRGKAGRSG